MGILSTPTTSSSSSSTESTTTPPFLPLAIEGLSLAIPSVILQLCLLLPYTISSIHLGHSSSPFDLPPDATDEDLAGYDSPSSLSLSSFSLANLVGNMTSLLLIIGILSTNDTLNPIYVDSKNNQHMLGILGIRGFVICLVALFPFVITWYIPASGQDGEDGITVLVSLCKKFGSDDNLLPLVSIFLKYYALCITPVLAFNCIQRFLNAQNIVGPLVCSAFLTSCIVHPLTLNILVDTSKFESCSYTDKQCIQTYAIENLKYTAVTHTITNSLSLFLLLVYLNIKKPYKASTWSGLNLSSLQQALSPGYVEMMNYIKLSLSGTLCLSEWIYWEYLTFLISSLGVLPLSIHTVGYTLIPLMYMIPLGCSIAVNILIGKQLSLGRGSVSTARKLALYGMIFTIALICITSLMLYVFRHFLIQTFTSDPDVIKGALKIWPQACLFIILDAIFGMQQGILKALSMQFKMSVVIFVCLWVMGMPFMYYVVMGFDSGSDTDSARVAVAGADLEVEKGVQGVFRLWDYIWITYTFMNLCLAFTYVNADWGVISDDFVANSKAESGGSRSRGGGGAFGFDDSESDSDDEEGLFKKGIEMNGGYGQVNADDLSLSDNDGQEFEMDFGSERREGYVDV